jgi:hypothetical protein
MGEDTTRKHTFLLIWAGNFGEEILRSEHGEMLVG